MLAGQRNKIPKIVVIGGGTGAFTVLSGLREYPVELSAVVSMADNGGSSGILRDELGVLPPGDVRQCLVALSRAGHGLRALFTHRFRRGGALRGHILGNLFLAACEDLTGSFADAVKIAGEVLQIRGTVIPVTLRNVQLCAKLGDGTFLAGENALTNFSGLQQRGIKKLFLSPKASAYEKALDTIRSADLLIMAPGNLYSSLIPNLLVRGVPGAIANSKARKVCVVNLMTKRGQTDDFKVHHFIEEMERWAGCHLFDTAVYNTKIPPIALLSRYQKEGTAVRFDKKSARRHRGVTFVGASLLSRKIFLPQKGDQLAAQRSFVRHDPDKLARVLVSLL